MFVFLVFLVYLSFIPGIIADMSIHLLNSLNTFSIKHLPYQEVNIRVGIHTGPCCAGEVFNIIIFLYVCIVMCLSNVSLIVHMLYSLIYTRQNKFLN